MAVMHTHGHECSWKWLTKMTLSKLSYLNKAIQVTTKLVRP